jgi:AraC-like DNA-binding protein
MRYASRTPAPPLDAFVDVLWWSERSAPLEATEHMLPTGTCQLVIALHDAPIAWAAADPAAAWQPWTHGVVHGPQSTFYRAGPKPAGAVVGAAFRPGAAGAILGVPCGELLDRHVPIVDLWGGFARELHERLAACAEPHAALRLLEQALIARIKTPLLMHPAVAFALRQPPMQPIESVRKQTGYSHRHLVALFRSAVGLTPKHYFRIRRISEAAQRLATRPTRIAELAADLGYADHAHLTREFRALCGVPPTAYRPRAPDSAHHHVAG